MSVAFVIVIGRSTFIFFIHLNYFVEPSVGKAICTITRSVVKMVTSDLLLKSSGGLSIGINIECNRLSTVKVLSVAKDF